MRSSFLLRVFCLLAAAATSRASDDKIRVELYYESQCPGCRAVVTNSFNEAFQAEGFLEMATVEFLPYGNARETLTKDGTYEFSCQHGPSECMYNTIENCAIDILEDLPQVFHFLNCIEHNDESRDVDQDYHKVLASCASLAGMDDETTRDVWDCANDDRGNRLVHAVAQKTEALDPPHDHVPWIVVNGAYSSEIADEVENSLLGWVCFAYTGPNRSPDCPPDDNDATTNTPFLRSSKKKKSRAVPRNNGVCYKSSDDDDKNNNNNNNNNYNKDFPKTASGKIDNVTNSQMSVAWSVVAPVLASRTVSGGTFQMTSISCSSACTHCRSTTCRFFPRTMSYCDKQNCVFPNTETACLSPGPPQS